MSSTVDLEAAGMNHSAMGVTSARPSGTADDDDDDDDDLSDDGASSRESGGGFGHSSSVNVNNVAAQLAAAGPVGVAAAAAITTGKKRKRPHTFETNPSIRKRQQTRILRKLKATIDEYATRVGQQAVVLLCTPGKPHNCYKVFGAKPLEDVIRSCKTLIMQELEHALAQQAPPPLQDDPTLHELPPLVIDGIPTPVEKMTQAQLRAFIPLMLKYATGRGKPGWGKESTRPPWWPDDLPWANVRSDVRSDDEKHRISWTHALRQIVLNCYRYHGRDDLLPSFIEGDENDEEKDKKPPVQNLVRAQYASTVVQTINNADGTLSIIHVDPNSTVVTLADGTQAQVQTIQNTHAEATQTVQTLADVATQGGLVERPTIELHGDAAVQAVATLTEATLNQDGQIILTGEDGQQAYPVSGMVTIPVSMYQTVVTSIAHMEQTDGQTNMQVVMAPQQQQQQQQQQLLTVATVQLPSDSPVQTST